MHFVRQASYLDGYRLKLTFEDGSVKQFDMAPYIETDSLMFRPLKQEDIFRMFTIQGDTVTWITGADVSPDFLYENGEKI